MGSKEDTAVEDTNSIADLNNKDTEGSSENITLKTNVEINDLASQHDPKNENTGDCEISLPKIEVTCSDTAGEQRTSIGTSPSSDDEDYLDVTNTDEHEDRTDDEGDGTFEQDELIVPYSSIYRPPLKLRDPVVKVFVPGKEIVAKVVNCERNCTARWQNPNLYTIEFHHGDFIWTVKKRYKHFNYLHQQLRIFRAGLNIPFPTRRHRERRASFKSDIRQGWRGRIRGRNLPRLPNIPDAQVRPEQMEERRKQLEVYLNAMLKVKVFRNHSETMNFLEVSPLSFVDQLGSKGKEGPVKKRTGSAQQAGCNVFGLFNYAFCKSFSHFCSHKFGRWGSRWLFVKDSCVGYIQFKTGRIKNVMLMDRKFEVTQSRTAHFLKISNMSRCVVLNCLTERKCTEWVQFLKCIAASKASDFTSSNRFLSFAPPREHTEAAWFVDGAGFMAAAANAILLAKEEIFIADWWLSPEIYLKRPANSQHTYRLDNLLERKASEGVKVFVMLFQEVKQALTINSKYSKVALMEKHQENIKVLRHPDHARVGILLWAHHEKILVVDQTYAFVGGIDLCYGRWDDHKHRLTDQGKGSTTTDSCPPTFLPQRAKLTSSRPRGNTMPSVLQLARSTNQLVRSMLDLRAIQTPEKCKAEEQDKVEEQHTPLRVIASRMRNRFRSLYNHGIMGSSTAEETTNEEVEGEPDDEADAKKDNNAEQDLDLEEMLGEKDIGLNKLWIGKDYMNCIVKDFSNLESPFQDLIDRETTPRLPWHDIGVLVQGFGARDVARHFIQRWNAIKLEKAKNKADYPYLLPKSYECDVNIPPLMSRPLPKVKCQVLRSVSMWSASFLHPNSVEQSIHEAYVEAIRNAKHYIYIENQFFITQVTPIKGSVENRVNQALYERILSAHSVGKTFRVIVVMPLLPAFEGEVGTPTGGALQTITHWNYASISRGKGAIIEKLKEAGIEKPENYISFYGLRTHAMLNGELVSELIYVHSKLLIADDTVVICGSANINDRSLLGSRDSEIAVILEDEEFTDSVMDGQLYQSGRFAGAMRRRLFREHLGLLEHAEGDALVKDPISDEFYHNQWRCVAERNSSIYEEVFHCIPSDKATSFFKLRKYQDETPLCLRDLHASQKMLKHVQGYLVSLPLKFLASENLENTTSGVEGLLPVTVWT